MFPLRRHLHSPIPYAALERIRVVSLVLAVGSLALLLPSLARGAGTILGGIGAVLLAIGLAAYWVRGYRRGGFAIAGEPLEALALFALLRAMSTSDTSYVPLFGLIFRSLYGTFPLSLIRYALWIVALLAGDAPRGHAYLQHSDESRAVGLAVAPLVFQALRRALERVQASERRLASLIQNSSDVVTVIGSDGLVRWQAHSIRTTLGHEPESILGTDLAEIVHPADRPALTAYFDDAAGQAGYSQRLALRMRHGDGGYRHIEVAIANRLHDSNVAGFVLNMRDATERRRLEDDLRALAAEREYDATHDPLTGLANRRKLFTHLQNALADAAEADTTLALLLIDLDRFKELNDTLGHHAGDQLLREIGPRLLGSGSHADLVARLGGDEFAVVLAAGVGGAEAELAAERLRRAIEQPFHFQGLTLLVRASLGIAIYPEHAQDVETLVQRADVATYSAKTRGAGHELYSPARDEHSRERLSLIGELPDAITRGELVVHYQPKFVLRTGQMVGVEALVRWNHPRMGLLGPGAFLPLAEQTGLMRPLTLRVIEDALTQCRLWQDQGLTLHMAVNLGAPNLLDTALASDVSRLLERSGVAASQLRLEITETIVAADPEHMIDVLLQLRALGIKLSLDDFGIGSSSLSFLRQLPVGELKIDKSFILGMTDDEQSSAIVRTVIDLARNLGLETVGEGIETEEVRQRLLEYGCDQGQGFLLARPAPAADITALAQASAAPPLHRAGPGFPVAA